MELHIVLIAITAAIIQTAECGHSKVYFRQVRPTTSDSILDSREGTVSTNADSYQTAVVQSVSRASDALEEASRDLQATQVLASQLRRAAKRRRKLQNLSQTKPSSDSDVRLIDKYGNDVPEPALAVDQLPKIEDDDDSFSAQLQSFNNPSQIPQAQAKQKPQSQSSQPILPYGTNLFNLNPAFYPYPYHPFLVSNPFFYSNGFPASEYPYLPASLPIPAGYPSLVSTSPEFLSSFSPVSGPGPAVETNAYLPPARSQSRTTTEAPTVKVLKQPVLPPAILQKEIFAVKNPSTRVLTYSDLCTVYPFQRKLSACIYKKAALPELHHPDIQVVPKEISKTPSRSEISGEGRISPRIKQGFQRTENEDQSEESDSDTEGKSSSIHTVLRQAGRRQQFKQFSTDSGSRQRKPILESEENEEDENVSSSEESEEADADATNQSPKIITNRPKTQKLHVNRKGETTEASVGYPEAKTTTRKPSTGRRKSSKGTERKASSGKSIHNQNNQHSQPTQKPSRRTTTTTPSFTLV